jgi:hypothetical protein
VVMRASVGVTVAAVMLGGCYDMSTLDPGEEGGKLVVDDFEDGTEMPSIPNFARWTIFPFKSGEGVLSKELGIDAPGSDDARALHADFVFAPLGGAFTGASVGIQAERVLLDARKFRALYVSARFESGGVALPDNARFYADLNCNSAPPRGNVTKPFWVTKNMPISADWKELRLEHFDELNTEEEKIDGEADVCLAVVDGIRFTVSLIPTAPIGVSLFIDNVYFQ